MRLLEGLVCLLSSSQSVLNLSLIYSSQYAVLSYAVLSLKYAPIVIYVQSLEFLSEIAFLRIT